MGGRSYCPVVAVITCKHQVFPEIVAKGDDSPVVAVDSVAVLDWR